MHAEVNCASSESQIFVEQCSTYAAIQFTRWFLATENPFENNKNGFLFYLKSSFRFKDI